MLLRPFALTSRALSRSFATAPPPHALVFLEHSQGVLESSSLSALTAAEQLGGKVTGLIIGNTEHVNVVLSKAKRYLDVYLLLKYLNQSLSVG